MYFYDAKKIPTNYALVNHLLHKLCTISGFKNTNKKINTSPNRKRFCRAPYSVRGVPKIIPKVDLHTHKCNCLIDTGFSILFDAQLAVLSYLPNPHQIKPMHSHHFDCVLLIILINEIKTHYSKKHIFLITFYYPHFKKQLA